jgi:pimeloyl-ACP methyl ester carboxylesterase
MNTTRSAATTPADLPTTSPPRRRRSGFLRWTRRLALAVLGLLVALVLSGAGYESIMSAGDAARYPQAGRLIDVGGHHLHLHCVGSGGPTVIMEGGGGGNILHWMTVQPGIALSTRICTYDRAGMGWSEPGPLPRTPGRIVAELHTLLVNAAVPGPYVLVGHSIGAKYMRLYADRYPLDVAGMVLVDPRHEDVDAALSPALRADDLANAQTHQRTTWVLGRLGIMRLMAPGSPDVPFATRRMVDVVASRPQALATQLDEYAHQADADAALRAAAPLGPLRLIVISSELVAERDPILQASMRTQAALSTDSRLVIAVGSGHAVQLDRPDVVIDNVVRVAEAARADTPLR